MLLVVELVVMVMVLTVEAVVWVALLVLTRPITYDKKGTALGHDADAPTFRVSIWGSCCRARHGCGCGAHQQQEGEEVKCKRHYW